MTATELKQTRAGLIQDQNDLNDKVTSESRDFTAEEQTEFDKRWEDIDKLDKQAKEQERLEKVTAELAEVPAPVSPPDNRDMPEQRDVVTPEARTAAYNNWFQRAAGGPASEIAALSPIEQRALQDVTDTAGGHLHPDQQWVGRLIQDIDNRTVARSLGQQIFQVPNADSLGFPGVSADVGDLTWTSELLIGSEDSTLAFNKRELSPHPLARYLDVSRTLLRKAIISPEALVRERLAFKFAAVMEAAFFTGTGASQPLGIMTASDMGISTGRDVSTGNAATALGADNIRECVYALKAQYRTGAQWIWHREGVKNISLLKDGNGNYLWRPGTTAGDPDTLFGLPVIESEYQNHAFTSALYVGILGNFSQYYWADSLNFELQRLDEIISATNEVRFICRAELDGMPVNENAFVRVKMG